MDGFLKYTFGGPEEAFELEDVPLTSTIYFDGIIIKYLIIPSCSMNNDLYTSLSYLYTEQYTIIITYL